MSRFTDAEFKAIQASLGVSELKTFQHASSPLPDEPKHPNHYLSIHEMDADTLRLDSSGGLPYILTTTGELCLQPAEYPEKVSGAGFIYFNAVSEINGISNDSDDYQADAASIFFVFWLLREHKIAMTNKVEVLQSELSKSTDLYSDELENILKHVSPSLQKTLTMVNAAVADIEEVDAEEERQDWEPPKYFPSQCGVFSQQKRTKTLHGEATESSLDAYTQRPQQNTEEQVPSRAPLPVS